MAALSGLVFCQSPVPALAGLGRKGIPAGISQTPLIVPALPSPLAPALFQAGLDDLPGRTDAPFFALRRSGLPLSLLQNTALRRTLRRLVLENKARRLPPGTPEYARHDPDGTFDGRGIEIFLIDELDPELDVAAYGHAQDGRPQLFLFTERLPQFMTARERRRLADHIRFSWLEAPPADAAIPAPPPWESLSPGRLAQRLVDQARTMIRLWRAHRAFDPFIRPFKGEIAGLMALSILAAFLVPATTGVMQKVIDTAVDGIAKNPESLLLAYVGATFAFKALYVGVEWWRRWLSYRLGTLSVFKLRAHFIERLSHLDMAEALRHTPEERAKLAAALHNNATFLPVATIDFKTHLPAYTLQLALSAALFFKEDWVLAALSLLVLPAFAALGSDFGGLHARYNLRYTELHNSLIAATNRLLSLLDLVKAYGIESHASQVLLAIARALADVALERSKLYANYRTFVGTVGEAAGLSVGLLCALSLFWHKTPSAGAIVAMQGYAFSMRAALEGMMNDQMSAQEAEGGLKAVADILAIPLEKDTAQTLLPSIEGHIEVQELSYSYDPKEGPALNGISFKVKPGEVIALVGDNGSGKTTLMRLLAGILQPTGGRVLVDGHDLAAVSRESHRAQQALLPQRQFLIGSVRQNLLAVKPQATEAELNLALDQAGARFVLEKPDGLDAEVSALSGGQQQLITAAMAILRAPRVLFIDEGTGEVSPPADAALQEVLWDRPGKRNVFVSSHRLETLKKTDRILFLERGKIVESGTYAELMALKGRFFASANSYK